jgi:hypothetical protein
MDGRMHAYIPSRWLGFGEDTRRGFASLSGVVSLSCACRILRLGWEMTMLREARLVVCRVG